ncbi:MAG: HAMP domain-containing protein [Rhodospirillaceae bacterium]|nr:HAMP domain-containing protein [Rhodospirillaceae bacterium]
MVERVPRDEQVALITRFSSPVMSLAITRGAPVVKESENRLASRVVLKKLAAEFPRGTDIKVDAHINGGFQAEAAAIDEEARSRFEDDFDAVPKTQPSEAEVSSAGSVARAFRRFFSRQEQARREEGLLHDDAPTVDEALFRVSIKAVSEGDRFSDGSTAKTDIWLNARVLLNVGEPQGQYLPFLWLTAISVLVGLIAFWGVRSATFPLSTFASAAERLGVDVNAAPLGEGGPSEVSRAARAFNTMQTRLQRFIQDRTQMLAAISHDLRTPITRLRLRAEFIDDDTQRRKMLTDLDEMEAMISATLVFARDDAANEMATEVDAAAIVAVVCFDHKAAGKDVVYTGPDSLGLYARPLAFKRAITNFIDNAVKYGSRARVIVEPHGADVAIHIDDDGPGIPVVDMERVFAPFTRLERSRSRQTGGTGLGMTIGRNAIRSMGGDVYLTNRPEGGLRVTISLPLAERQLLAAE